jgi:hypothetical protein
MQWRGESRPLITRKMRVPLFFVRVGLLIVGHANEIAAGTELI